MNIMNRLGPAGYEVSVQSVTVVAHEAVMLSVVQPGIFYKAVGIPCWKNDYLKCTTCPAVSNVQRAGATRARRVNLYVLARQWVGILEGCELAVMYLRLGANGLVPANRSSITAV